METAWPGELAVYQMLFGPLATQHGAFVGYAGAGPRTGKTLRSESTIAKLSGLCAGVKPRTSPQNAAPSGVLFASSGRVMVVLDPLSPPSCPERPNWRTEPDFMVTAAQVLPATTWAAELSESVTTLPSRCPEGQEWLSAQSVLTT